MSRPQPFPAAALQLAVAAAALLLLLQLGCLGAPNPNPNPQAQASQQKQCAGELEHANRTLASWAQTMESMVNESKLPGAVRESVHLEANKVLDAIEDFGEQLRARPAGQLARDLVAIRRQANRLALDVYLNTFDMRWPQQSLQLGVIVERVQQACLDRAQIQLLEAPEQPLQPLATGLQ